MRTKIVCTVGPSTNSERVLRKIVKYVDVFRINFSHGTLEEHREQIERIRKVCLQEGKEIPVMQDLPGPKLRLGKIRDEKAILKAGQKFRLVFSAVEGNEMFASVNHPEYLRGVSEGDVVYLADGIIKMRVSKKTKEWIECNVIDGGVISSGKGIKVRGSRYSFEYPTKEDIEKIRFGLENNVEMIALSFVRDENDVMNARKYTGDAFIVSKIETKESVIRIDEIIRESNAIMIARGDLGLDVRMESLPEIQRKIIEKCRNYGKPSIVATQMLNSMILNPIPTRAEVSDVVGAVNDGADALMLSDETAVGMYPVESIKTLARIASYAERIRRSDDEKRLVENNLEEAVSKTACMLADYSGAKIIVAPTQTGATARRVSKFRPKQVIVALCIDKDVAKQLMLQWGVIPYLTREVSSTDELFEQAVRTCIDLKLVSRGDKIVVTSGTPGQKGSTNMVKVITV